MRVYAVTAGLLLFCLSVSAQAQIYSWRDATGTLVLSNQQLSPDAKTYAVAATTVFRATRPVPGTSDHDRHEPLIQTHAAANGLPADLVRTVIQVESGFDSRAQSPKGAIGLMQLMPAAAVDLGVRDPYDPDQNIRGGSAYLRRLLDRFDGDETLALAAYNAGPEAVRRHGGRVPPYEETQDYVRKVERAAGRRQPPAASQPAAAGTIYKILEIIDGRPVTRYSTEGPAETTQRVVSR